jgi:hypothetical protein
MRRKCGVVGCVVLRRVGMEVLWRRIVEICVELWVRVWRGCVWEAWEAFLVGGGAAIAVSRKVMLKLDAR